MKSKEYKEAMKTPYNRKELIDLIYTYSGEEFEDIKDVWKLAEETDNQLANRVQDIYAYCNDFDTWVINVSQRTKHNRVDILDFQEHYSNLLDYKENLKNFEKHFAV